MIDANVFAAALLRRNGVPRRAIDLIFERGQAIWTAAIFDELNDVLRRSYFRLRVEDAEREALLTSLILLGERVEPLERIRMGRDPKDDKYLEAAIAGAAVAIVTGDGDLLVLDPFRGIRILAPARFLEFAASAGR